MKHVGKGVNDYSGPYREVFADAIREIVDICQTGRTSLGVLEPNPNKVTYIREDRSLFVFVSHGVDFTQKLTSLMGGRSVSIEESIIHSYFSSYLCSTSDSIREADEYLVFLGRLSGTASRHGLPLDLPLHLPPGLV